MWCVGMLINWKASSSDFKYITDFVAQMFLNILYDQ